MVLPNAPEPSGRRKMFVCIPGSGLGYVGVSTVTGEAMRFDDAVLNVDGVDTKMADLPLTGSYRHDAVAEDSDEYIVPVQWITAVDRSDAILEKGFFANQNSACKLWDRFTLIGLACRFSLTD